MEPRPDEGTSSLENQFDAGGRERRASRRRADFRPGELRVERELRSRGGAWTIPPYSGISAKLVDLSETGMGLQILSPLRVNAEVGVCVNLYRDDSGEELKARAQVMHCRAEDDGLYRVGLAFQGVYWRALDTGYYPDLDAGDGR